MKNGFITTGVAIVLSILALGGSWLAYENRPNEPATITMQNTTEDIEVGTAPRVFTSDQVGTGATTDYILSTNGATSTWIVNTGGGGGAGSGTFWGYVSATDILSPFIASTSNTAIVTGSSFNATSTATSSTFGGGFLAASSTITGDFHITGESIMEDSLTLLNGVPTLIFDDTHAGHDKYRIRIDSDMLHISAGSPLIDLMTFDSTNGGNVGIGSTTPSSKLTVGGNAWIDGNLTATGTLAVTALSTLTGGYVSQASSTVLGNFSVTGAYFDSNSTSGTLGQILSSTVTGTDWISTSTLGLTASDIAIALNTGSPTVDQVQEYIDNTGSSGFFLGGELSDGGSGTVDVAAGSGFIRTTNDDNAPLLSFKWSASSTIAVTDNTTQYVYVDDSGVISLDTDEFLEAPDKIKLGVVTDEAGAIESTFALGVRLQESIGQMGRFSREVHGIARDNRGGGLIFGQSGDANRDLTMTTGELWWGRTEYTINAIDTSGADTFATYSAGGQEDAVASQWPNTQYDNAGTLTTMTNNRWANLFFWLEPDDHLVMVYGRGEFVTEAQAENELVPSDSLPSRITETGILTGRFTFQKSANSASISSAFEELFANAGVTSHSDLAGLTNDDHTQYLRTDGTRLLTGNWNAGAFTIFATSTDVTNASTTNLSVSGYFDFLGTVITDVSTWFNGLFDTQLATKDLLNDLDTLGANSADNEFIVGTGAGALAWESGATVRTSLDVDQAGTDNSTDVTLAGTSNYITIDGSQVITRAKLDISDDTNMTAGRSLTLSSNDVLADAELYTDTKAFNYSSSTMATSTEIVLSWLAPQATTITTITCNEVGAGATSTVMFEERTALNTAGTDVLYGNGITAGGDNATASSTLSNNTIASGSYLVMTIGGYFEGTPDHPICDVKITYDD